MVLVLSLVALHTELVIKRHIYDKKNIELLYGAFMTFKKRK